MKEEFSFHSISSNFEIAGKYASCERYGEGHINDTFRLTMNERGKEMHYILQRINDRLFTDVEKLMRNIELVTEFCRRSVETSTADFAKKSWIKSLRGRYRYALRTTIRS